MAKKEDPHLVRGTYKGAPTWFIVHLRRRRHASADRAEAEAKLAEYVGGLGREDRLARTRIEVVCEWAKTGMPPSTPIKGMLADWGGRTVGDVSQASVDARLREGGANVGNARHLVRAIARYAKAQGLPGASIVRFPFKPPRREQRNLTKSEVARLLWACLGHRWHPASATMRPIPRDGDLDAGRKARALRRPIARVILLAVYAGVHPERSRNLRWRGTPGGDRSFVSLPEEGTDPPGPWPLPAEKRRLSRLGADAPKLEKLKGVDVTLPSRITAHLLRWRRKDLPRFQLVVHGQQVTSRYAAAFYLRFDEVCADAGLPGLKSERLLATFAAFALREGAIMRNLAISMGIAFETAERLYRHLARDFMKGIKDASKRRAVSTR